jgi:hypothetical protein
MRSCVAPEATSHSWIGVPSSQDRGVRVYAVFEEPHKRPLDLAAPGSSAYTGAWRAVAARGADGTRAGDSGQCDSSYTETFNRGC